MSRAPRPSPRIAILGAGFAGLGLAILLRKAGIECFTIFEKDERLGGTWRDNTYPGAACDLASFAYCFSFEQKTDWSRKWSPQAEILAYMEHCARKYGLLPHIRFGCEIAEARFDAEAGVWRLRTTRGEEHEAEVLVSGVGQLHRPVIPDLPGLETFEGPAFHSARWDHGVDLRGKRVGVVGNAASAIQFIPQLAPEVERLTVFQRSANWMLPRNDRAFSGREKWCFSHLPGLARLYRWWIWLRQEIFFYPVMRGGSWLSRRVEQLARQYIREHIADPELRRALVPDYPIGGKRILISDDYYQALARPNVRVVLSPIERVTREGIATRDGETHHFDALIFATGFDTNSFLAPMKIQAPDGRFLSDVWREGAEAYLGITVAGFPNLFLMYGPNTNLGHNSIIFMLECQAGYILSCLRQMRARGLAWIAPRRDVTDAWNRKLQAELARTVWARTDRSWYKTRAGRITNNWSGTTLEYWWRTRRADLGAYDCKAAK
jgi:cation diffusion facilitator CzcD-associated flavoprotein CzcO